MRNWGLIVAAILIVGTIYRLWPIAAGMPALGYFFITEDGYLMLTVARNIATGLGMSVSDGTIPTNGVQPLATYLFALPYAFTGGDKVTSLVGIHLIHAATALAGVFAIRAFATRVFAPRNDDPVWPWVVALLWFISPLLLRHSMNGLETSLYTLALVVTLLAFAGVLARDNGASPGARLFVGALCGVAVLARNDAVFFVTALFLVWGVWELFVARTPFVATLVRLVPPGLLSIAVASPWLVSNQIRFGSIVPVSGPAQSVEAEFAQNAWLIPSRIFEYIFPMLPLPRSLEVRSDVIALVGAISVVVLLVFLWRIVRHGSPVARALVMVYLLHAFAISGYYGLFFGAPHFMSRYHAPLAPLLITAGLAAALEMGRLIRSRPNALAWAYTGAGVVLSAALLLRALLPGQTLQGHEQVIAWVEENVAEETWVGAVQTGTLGYWHDRTINLDGKVNPAALAARREDGHVLNYVTESEIDYVVDWSGVGNWVDFPQARDGYDEAFERVLQDRERNLSVQRRIDR